MQRRYRLGRLVVAAASCSAVVGIGLGALALNEPPAAGQTAVTTPLTTPLTTPTPTTPVTHPATTAPPAPSPTTAPPTSAPATTAPTPVPTTAYRPPVYVPRTYVTVPRATTTAPSTTTTTVAPIKAQIPSAPSTLPFITKGSNAHVDPALAKVSLGGFALALLLLVVQFVLTRPGRRGRRTL